MKKLNIGLAGLGRLGKEYGKNIQFKIPNANLVAVCSLVEEELAYAKKELEVSDIYSTYESMLEHPNMDAVVIITSTNSHAEHIIKAMESGLHVFCEKPLSIDIENCLKVEEEAKKYSNLIVMIGFNRRYDPSYVDAKKTIIENKVGKPFFVRSQTVDKDIWAPFQLSFVKTSGGVFHDFNVHDVDLARWYIGSEVKRLWSQGGAYRFKEFGDLGDADNTFVFCEFEDGSMALLGASRTSSYGHDTFTEIIGTEGKLTVGNPPSKNRVQISDKHGVRNECNETFYDRFKDSFLIQVQDFVNSVLEGKEPECNLENATKATIVTCAMTESFKTKGIVEIKDIMP